MNLEFDLNPNPMFVYDRGTLEFLAVNDAAIAHYGYSRAEFMSMTIHGIYPPEQREGLEERLPRNKSAFRSSHVKRHLLKNGHEIYVQVTGINIDHPDSDDARMILINDLSDRIRVEKELEKTKKELSESQNHLTQMLNNLPGVIFRFSNDNNWSLKYASAGIKTLTGYAPEHFVGRGYEVYEAMIPVEDRERVRNEMQKAINEKRLYQIEYQIRTASGEEKWISERGLAIEGHGDEIIVDGFLSDITHLKEVEDDLAQREQQFRTLFEYNPAATYCLDMEGRITLANRMTAEISGYDMDEIIGMNIQPTVPPEEWPHLEEMFSRSTRGAIHSFEIQAKKKSGKPLVLQIVNMPMYVDGVQTGVIGVAEDVTERRKAEEAHRRSEELFRKLFELTPVGVVMFDQEKHFSMINNEFQNIFGYSEEDVIGKRVNDMMTPPGMQHEPDEFFERLYKDGELRAETTRLAKDGTAIPVLINSSIVEVMGHIEGNLVTYVDMSEQKKAKESLQISLKEKEILLAEIHHRVKNNLAIVYGLLQLQLSKNNNVGSVHEVLLKSQSRIRSIAMIHEKLYRSDSFSEINFDDYIKDLVAQLCDTYKNEFKKIKTVTNTTPVSLTITQAVPCALILNELVVNVFKHAFPGKNTGTLRVNLKREDGGLVALSVEDDGIGISNNEKSPEAPTLGMTLIKTLVQQLKADYRVDGKSGTRIEISFSIKK